MIRPMILAQAGWYSGNKDECKKEIIDLIDKELFLEGITPISAVVPHAGWFFSGRLAVNAIKILKEKNGIIENVFVFGGHLSPLNLPILETFDFAETPFGQLENNKPVLDLLKSRDDIQTTQYLQDNTIEVLLPIIHYFFGNVKITAIYLPPNLKIRHLLDLLYEQFKQESVFIGSTDLTHYGPNYGLFHKDKSLSPIEWVKNVNDKKMVDYLLEMNEEKMIEYSATAKAACSAGAALGAMHMAKANGVGRGHLIKYFTSYDVHQSDSFVGYAGVIY